jgi:3-oxoacyl-[acyl-carrier protein] reductase
VKLEGRVAVITGSSRGIGRAIAEAFFEEGARVVVNSRSAATARETAAEIGKDVLGLAADVSTEEGAQRLIEETVEFFGRVDVLVNNAGQSMVRDSLELTLADWQSTFDLNLTAAFLCAQRAARSMLDHEGGAIVNIASVTSFAGFPRRLAYATTKAGLVMMTKVMAVEWAPKVRVNAIAPGFIETDLVRALREEGKLDFEALKRRTPMGRLGTPEEVAKAAVFLASDDASYVTGETLVADGGWLAYGFT